MKVETGVQVLLMEVIEQWCPALRDVAVAEWLSDHGTIFSFCQGIVIRLPGTGPGELDAQFLQQFGDPLVDVFRAVAGVKTGHAERDRLQ